MTTLTDSQTHRLRQDGDRDVSFDGVLLGSASSETPDSDRWFEVSIYRTVGGRYLVAGIGRSRVDGETDRHWVVECESGGDVVAALTRTDPEGIEYLTRTARDAIDAAAATDDSIRDSFLRRVA